MENGTQTEKKKGFFPGLGRFLAGIFGGNDGKVDAGDVGEALNQYNAIQEIFNEKELERFPPYLAKEFLEKLDSGTLKLQQEHITAAQNSLLQTLGLLSAGVDGYKKNKRVSPEILAALKEMARDKDND